MEEKTIDVIIPTYKPGKEFQELLKRLMKQKKAFNKIFLLQTIEDGEKPMESNDPKIEVYPIAKKILIMDTPEHMVRRFRKQIM